MPTAIQPAMFVERIGVKPETPGERGLPKPEVDEVRLGPAGLDGDFNRYREEKLDGDLDSAVLIVTAELIEQLNTEGWPVKPGDLGENLTTVGLDYDSLEPGQLFRVGSEVVLEITRLCQPCEYLGLLPYVGSEVDAAVKAMVDRRGRYAKVRVGGTIRRRDPIVYVGGEGE
jgi:MOSC domain-containing protein YiiM